MWYQLTVSSLFQVIVWRQAITWTNVDILSVGTYQTKYNEMLIQIQYFPLKKMHVENIFKMAAILFIVL